MIVNDIPDPQEEALSRLLQGCDLIKEAVAEHSMANLAAELGTRDEKERAFERIETATSLLTWLKHLSR
jgi:hypothetical protein